MTECYDKPVWNLQELLAVLPAMPRFLVRLLPTIMDVPITSALRERIMLAVAAENRCWYCQTAHTIFGQASGVPTAEINSILAGDLVSDPDESLVLEYVRDLARRDFKSHDKLMRQKLQTRFNERQVAAIEASAHVMNLANRFGNTFDAARERVRGACVASKADIMDMAVIAPVFLLAAGCVTPILGALKLMQTLSP